MEASLVAQMVKNPPATLETWVRSLGWKDPLEKGTCRKACHEWLLDPSRDLPNPGITPRSPTLQADSLPSEPPGKLRILEWVAYPFSRGSSWPRNWTSVSCIAGRFFRNWTIREAQEGYKEMKIWVNNCRPKVWHGSETSELFRKLKHTFWASCASCTWLTDSDFIFPDLRLLMKMEDKRPCLKDGCPIAGAYFLLLPLCASCRPSSQQSPDGFAPVHVAQSSPQCCQWKTWGSCWVCGSVLTHFHGWLDHPRNGSQGRKLSSWLFAIGDRLVKYKMISSVYYIFYNTWPCPWSDSIQYMPKWNTVEIRTTNHAVAMVYDLGPQMEGEAQADPWQWMAFILS